MSDQEQIVNARIQNPDWKINLLTEQKEQLYAEVEKLEKSEAEDKDYENMLLAIFWGFSSSFLIFNSYRYVVTLFNLTVHLIPLILNFVAGLVVPFVVGIYYYRHAPKVSKKTANKIQKSKEKIEEIEKELAELQAQDEV